MVKEYEFEIQKSGAEFDKKHTKRYILWRSWDDAPRITWVGLNPSRADEEIDDPTIRRVIQFSKDWGYGGLYMVNLFTFITPYPKDLETMKTNLEDDLGWIRVANNLSSKIIFCWGKFDIAKSRAKIVEEKFNGYCLGINKDGSPKHPLYCSRDLKPIKF